MQATRRRLLQFAAASAATATVPRIARAQAYPRRPVRIILGYPAGGPSDILARLIGQWLSEHLHQSFIVESRSGAGGNIATEFVIRAPADGYTLLLVTTANAINASLYNKLSFDFIRDTAPVAGLIRVPQVVDVTPSLPVKTIPELIAYAKASPGKLNFASAGNGTVQHVAGELFRAMTGVNMQHVPYRGQAPALLDLLAGHAQVMFDTLPASIQYVKGGQVRALAVTTATRFAALPDLPRVADFVPGYESSAFYGISAPRSTPADVIERLNREINAGLADPTIRARLADLASTPLPGSAADFGKLIADETVKWSKVVKLAGAKAE